MNRFSLRLMTTLSMTRDSLATDTRETRKFTRCSWLAISFKFWRLCSQFIGVCRTKKEDQRGENIRTTSIENTLKFSNEKFSLDITKIRLKCSCQKKWEGLSEAKRVAPSLDKSFFCSLLKAFSPRKYYFCITANKCVKKKMMILKYWAMKKKKKSQFDFD